MPTAPAMLSLVLAAALATAPMPIEARRPLRPPKGYVCYRAEKPPVIDGRLDDPAWRSAPWTDLFVDIEGDAKPKPRLATRAKMLWDDRYFYVAARLEEPHVWATLTEHDSVIFHDNDFEVFIDPDGDNHQYYEIEINALNTEWDLRLAKPYRDGGPPLNAWEIPGLKTAVHVEGTLNDSSDRDRGWTVEMAFPWSVLAEFANRPAPPRDGDQWRVNFSRVEWKTDVVNGRYVKRPGLREDNWVWSPQGAVDMHRPERWGYVQFSRKTRGPVAFRPDPAWPARERLMRLYYAERAYHERTGRWALGVEPLGVGDWAEGIRIEPVHDGYVATLETQYPDGSAHRWHVRQDSRLWEEPVTQP